MKKLVYATHNAHKLEELRAIIKNFDIVGLTDINCHEDIVEDADTLDGNAKIKADFVTNNFHIDCFADDTGLEVDALDGAPGVYSARYAGEGCSYQDNVNKLLEAFEGVENRKARFRTVIALNLYGEQHFFEGKVEGESRIGGIMGAYESWHTGSLMHGCKVDADVIAKESSAGGLIGYT